MSNISKEKIEELMNLPGETRGISIKGDLEYIIHREGKEGLKKLEGKLEELLGYPIKYEDMEEMNFYPVGIEAITLSAMQELFSFKREDFKKMGEFNSKVSLIVRLFMKYFISLDVIAKQAPNFWSKYYTTGEIKVTEINNDEKYIIIQLRDFEHSPLHCATVEGYLVSIIKMVTGSSITSEETKCPHQGDDYHEFVVRWG